MKTGQEQLSFLNMILLLFAAGIFVAAWQVPPFSSVLAACGLLSLLALAAVLKKSGKTWIVFGLLFFALGALRFGAASRLPETDVSFLAEKEVEICGELLEAPHFEKDKDTIKARYLIAAETVKEKQGTTVASGNLYVHARHKNHPVTDVEIGDRLKVRGVVRGLHDYNNPGRIDTVLMAKVRGITARLFAAGGDVSIEKNTGFVWRRLVEQVRSHYRSIMESVMPKEDAAAIFAMLFGGYEGIKPELTAAFTTTGIVHILSVSGSHISLLAATIAFWGKRLRLGRFVMFLLVGGAIVLYCLLAGGVAPAIRAGIMGLIAFMGELGGRERDAKRILSLTGLGMLIISPWQFFDISFRLSFLSTAGLLYIAPLLQEKLSGLPDFVSLNASVTVGAQLAVLPMLAWYFNNVSLSALIANIVVVPVVELMIVIGLAAGLLGMIIPFAGKLVFFADSLFLGIVYELSRLIARLPFASVYLPTMNAAVEIVYYVLLFMALRKNLARHVGLIVVAAVVFVCSYQFTRPLEMAVHFIDVGQGDAALIVTPHGKGIMVDTGGTLQNAYDIGERVVVPYLFHYGITELDSIYLTHAHADHAAGAGSIIKKVPVGAIITARENREEYAKVMGISYANDIFSRMAAAVEGDVREVDGVKIETLFAPPKGTEQNESSNVIRISYQNASFLFTGDLPVKKENGLLAVANPQSTVLKVAHHGSKTSTGDDFLAAVNPQFAVISVGAGNSFGHPNREVLEKLSIRGIEISRTDRDGAVVFRTDGKRMEVEKYCQ